MNLFLDSFWRAAVYCLRPRVMLLSILPLVLIVVLALGLGYFFWDAALDQMRIWMDAFAYTQLVWQWLESVGAGQLKAVLAPLLVVFGVTPLIVVGSMLAVAWLMTPALVNLVAVNRFAALEAKQGGGLFSSMGWALFSTLLAGIALLVSVPLWLVPPLVLLIPPLIWGWLTYRVMAFDALARHASTDERQALFKRHGGWLLAMGVVSGFLGASPSVLWAMGAGFAPAFVLLVPVAIWVYTLVFAFASLWFTHYCLAALQSLRLEAASVQADEGRAPDTVLEPQSTWVQSPAMQDTTALTWKDGK
jgi:hypothetical protein